MPIVDGKYVSPNWSNDAPPPINSAELLALCQTVANFNETLGNIVPIGSIFWLATQTIPSGYLKCDGSSLSRTTYAGLFAVIGTAFGGSGTNFNLPNLSGRFVRGTGSGGNSTGVFAQLKDAGGVYTDTNGYAILYYRNINNSNLYSAVMSDASTYYASSSYRPMPATSQGLESNYPPRLYTIAPSNICLTAIIKY